MEIFTSEGVRNQLAKILSSSQLSGSPVLTEFLSFIVNETLAGRGPDLKEYTIGVSALKKDSSFNPQLDGIVRIHAGRLRRALKEYYYEKGITDPIVISIPKGSYLPTFEARDNQLTSVQIHTNGTHTNGTHSNGVDRSNGTPTKIETKQFFDPDEDGLSMIEGLPSNHKPSVAVLPFKKIGQGDVIKYFVQGFGEFLSTELTQFDNLKIISNYSADHIYDHPLNIKKIGMLLDAEYLFTGSVQLFDEKLRLCVQLNCTETGDQLWAKTFDENPDGGTHREFQTKAVDEIIGSVAGITGTISRHELSKNKRLSGDNSMEPSGFYSLAYWYTQYARNFEKNTVQKARRFYEKVISEEPNNAMAMAFLAEIIAGEMLLMQDFDQRNDLGIYYSNKAIRIDPYCQQAYQALAINKLLHRQNDECVHILEQGYQINPKSTDYKASMGALLIFAGQFDRGVKILDSVIQLNSPMFWWQMLSYSYYAYYRKFYMDALYWADRVEMQVAWIPVIKAASYGQLEQYDQARAVLEDLRYNYPEISLDDPDFLRKLFYSDTLVLEIGIGLQKAEQNSRHITR